MFFVKQFGATKHSSSSSLRHTSSEEDLEVLVLHLFVMHPSEGKPELLLLRLFVAHPSEENRRPNIEWGVG